MPNKIKIYSNGPETLRLIHREFNTTDADVFFTLASDPVINRYTGENPLDGIEHAFQRIQDYPDFKTVGFGRWACVLKETNAVIGFCGLKYLPELDAVDIGYRFMPDFWGKGIATEACQACIDFGFEVIGLNEIIGLADPQNRASIRVLEKCGMLHVGQIEFDKTPAEKYVINRSDQTTPVDFKTYNPTQPG